MILEPSFIIRLGNQAQFLNVEHGVLGPRKLSKRIIGRRSVSLFKPKAPIDFSKGAIFNWEAFSDRSLSINSLLQRGSRDDVTDPQPNSFSINPIVFFNNVYSRQSGARPLPKDIYISEAERQLPHNFKEEDADSHAFFDDISSSDSKPEKDAEEQFRGDEMEIFAQDLTHLFSDNHDQIVLKPQESVCKS